MPRARPDSGRYAAAPFRYAERAPSRRIAPWVLSLWAFHADATPAADDPYTVWPDGCASIALVRDARGSALVCIGPRLTALTPPVEAGRTLAGFRLWPDALTAATGLSPQTLRDHVGPAPETLWTRFAGLDAALPRTADPDALLPALDDFLAARLEGAPAPDPRVRAAVVAIVAARGEAAMPRVAAASGVGLRQLQRRFAAATGLTLRDWARVRRLREALAHRIAAQPPGWSRIAAETGFVDHAHLTREFVALTGVRPSDAARHLDRTRHDAVTP